MLYLICGHGAGDPGAVGGSENEAENVRRLAQRVKALAKDQSQVQIHDMNRNAYASRDLASLSVPKGTNVLELHRDSSNGTARGAHVIIKNGYKADDFDTKLAKNLAKIFPGRSSIIVERDNLYNVNTAAKRGINYRLAEVGFIDNLTDRQIFNTRLDEIARAILDAAGIAAVDGAPASTVTSTATNHAPTATSTVTVDGYWGVKTTIQLQNAMGTPPDGEIWGQYAQNRKYMPNCTGGFVYDYPTHKGSPAIKQWQKRMGMAENDCDGILGPGTFKHYQRKKGIYADGVCGPKTVKAIQNDINSGKL